MIKQRILKSLAVMAVLLCVAAVPAFAQSSKVLVTNVSPDGGSANVGADTNISATFNIRMAKSTINNKTFYLKQQGSSAMVPAQVTYRGTTKTATLNPNSDLASGATYTATIKGGQRGVKASNGALLGGTRDSTATFANGKVTWSFTVANDPPPPSDTERPFLVNYDPTPGARNVPVDVSPKATVNESLRPNSVNTQGITMYEESNQPQLVNIAVSYDENTKTISVDPTADLKEGTIYAVKISGIVDLAGNVQDGYQGWSFGTGDATAPTVSSVTPTDGATKVSINTKENTKVTATFSEEMDSSTVTNQSFTLSKSGSPVSAQVTYDANSLTATLDPDQNLENSTTYEAKITTTVKDLAGNAITQQKSWSFTTADPGVTFTPDPLNFASDPLCSPESKTLIVNNNGPGDVTFANVSITGPDAARFRTNSQWFLANIGPFTVRAGNNVKDPVTFIPEGGRPQPRTYSATLTYKDGTGATIGSPVTLSATTTCLVFG